MYLDIVLIDTLTPDGVMTSFKVTPKHQHQRVLIDRQRDIYPDRFGDELDLGGTRIYNSQECSILRTDTRLRAFVASDHTFSFQFEHMGIPIGLSRESHGGIYNLLLAPGFRLVDFCIVDPYDHKHEDIRQKKQFKYDVIWDKECKVQLVEMNLRSNRGSFSFIVHGEAVLVDSPGEHNFVEAKESGWQVSKLTNKHMLRDDGKQVLAKELAKKVDWIDLKPNVFGIGININEILKSCFKVFKRKVNG